MPQVIIIIYTPVFIIFRNNNLFFNKAKIAEQDKEYIPLMAEREEEYHQEMKEKMNKFLIEHAARVIQNAWREVLANRAEKKRVRLS